jgi:hemolysin III
MTYAKDVNEESTAEVRPLLRGWIHFGSAIAAVWGLVVLLVLADSWRTYLGAATFGVCVLLLFSASASYHLLPWRPRARRWMKRLDHSMIFVAVAGILTPFCVVVLDSSWGIPLLGVTWALAIAGVIMKMGWPDLPRKVGVTSYLVIGWLPVVAAPEMIARMPGWAMAVVVACGLLYSVGGLAYGLRWPNPSSRVFGHHEVFHSLVSVATLGMYVVVASAVAGA